MRQASLAVELRLVAQGQGSKPACLQSRTQVRKKTEEKPRQLVPGSLWNRNPVQAMGRGSSGTWKRPLLDALPGVPAWARPWHRHGGGSQASSRVPAIGRWRQRDDVTALWLSVPLWVVLFSALFMESLGDTCSPGVVCTPPVLSAHEGREAQCGLASPAQGSP